MTARLYKAQGYFLRAYMLLLLAEGPRYGYELMTHLAERGYGDPDVGGLYRTLRSMEAEDLLTSYWDVGDFGPARHVYAITDQGWAKLEEYGDAVHDIRSRLDQFLQDCRTVRGAGR